MICSPSSFLFVPVMALVHQRAGAAKLLSLRFGRLRDPEVRYRRRTLLVPGDNAAREYLALFEVLLDTVRHEGFPMPRPRPMKRMGLPGQDPPLEIVHFWDPWSCCCRGQAPRLLRLREG